MLTRMRILAFVCFFIFLQCVVALLLFEWEPTLPVTSVEIDQFALASVQSSLATSLNQSSTAGTSSTSIDELVEESTLIVRGRISETHSYWSESGSTIHTENLVEVRYMISKGMDDGTNGMPSSTKGKESEIAGSALDYPATIRVLTEGGFIEESSIEGSAGDDGIGMKSSHSPLYRPNDEVIIFLQEEQERQDDQVGVQWRVVKGELGNYFVNENYVINSVRRAALTIESFYDDLAAILEAKKRAYLVPEDWKESEQAADAIARETYDGLGFVYKDRKWGGSCPEIKYAININSSQVDGDYGSTEDFRNAVIAAADTWSAVQSADYTLTYDGTTDALETGYNGVNEVIFSSQGVTNPTGLARFWFNEENIILEADIWFNDNFEWDATNDPPYDRVDLQSAALHEFGHWLALGHDSDPEAVMHQTLTMGTLKRTLNQNDIDGISFIYPRPADSACEIITAVTQTPTATPTATNEPTATHTPTATNTSTATGTPTATSTPDATQTPTATEESDGIVDPDDVEEPEDSDDDADHSETPTVTDTPTATVISQDPQIATATSTPTSTPTSLPPQSASQQLEINYPDGVPGSFFTIRGTGYRPNEVTGFFLDETFLGEIQASSSGEFTLILSTLGASVGVHTVQVPSMNQGSAQLPPAAQVFSPYVPNEAVVTFLLSPDSSFRAKQVTGLSPSLQTVEIMLPSLTNLFLPFVAK
ncbi:MAG: matrixin family metalloprotease [Chloroflexota bacterium]